MVQNKKRCFSMVSMKEVLIYSTVFVLVFVSFLGLPMSVNADASNMNKLIPAGDPGDPVEAFTAEDATPTGTTYRNFDNFGGYWCDAEKTADDTDDDLMCWAAAASNMLEYTGWGLTSGMWDSDANFEHFNDHWEDQGALISIGVRWWFDGTVPSNYPDDPPYIGGAASWAEVDVAGGGEFWTPTYDYTSYLHTSSSGNRMETIDSYLHNGWGVGLGIYDGGHAITCWGVNYDTDYDQETEWEDYYVGIWVTDSDDDKGKNSWEDVPNRLRYYEVDYHDSAWYIQGYGGGNWFIDGVYGLEPFPTTRPVASAGASYTGYEGSAITFSGAGSSDADGDTLKYRWDFDGDMDWDTSFSTSSSASHTWYDDYSGTVNLQVYDGHIYDIASTTVTVYNVAPTISVSGDTIDEDDYATVSGTITDPGTEDTFAVTINWGEGSPVTYNYAAGTTYFSETHQYHDDNPTATASDVYSISVSIEDDDGGSDTDSTTVTVNNVAPDISASGDWIDEDGVATVSGTITDPGTQDTFTLEIDWGEGAPETYSYPAGSTSYSETHQYLDDNPTATLSDIYTITVTVTDDDTGTDTILTTVTVDNVDPVTTIDSMAQPNPEFILPIVHTLDFFGSFTDVGTLDTHTAVWDWGDMTSDIGVLTEAGGSGTVTGSHVYMAPGIYTVTLTVTDDDGGYHSDTFLVEVVDAHGALEIMNEYIQSLDDSAFDKNPANQKKALNNMINALHNMVDEEDYNGAINDMQHNFRGKVDGTMGGKAGNDWIVDGGVQYDLTMKLDDISAYLATFL